MEIVTDQQIIDVVLSGYGFHVTSIERLPGYSDLNCHVTVTPDCQNPNVTDVAADGYLIKIFHNKKTERVPLIRGWQALMKHLTNHGLPVPQLTPTVGGDLVCYTPIIGSCGTGRVAYMYTYIAGVRMDKLEPPAVDRFFTQIGQLAGRVTTAVKSFSHPAFDTHRTIWRFDSVPDMAELVDRYCIGDDRELLMGIIDMYKGRIQPNLDRLPKGVIHGDVAPHNVLLRKDPSSSNVDYIISGLVDFSDGAESLYIFEVACTISYMLKLYQDDNTCSVITVCRGIMQAYMKEATLLDEEKNLLQLCVCIRLLQLFILGTDVLDKNPENTYVKTHTEGNLEMIRKLTAIGETEFVNSVF